MSSSSSAVLFLVGAAACIAFVVGSVAFVSLEARSRWPWPFALLAAFAAISVRAVVEEGPLGFWREHTRGAWATQIWFDLLIAASIGWILLLPRARRAGMRLWFWAIAVPMGGSLGLLAMLARVLYLEGRKGGGKADA